MFDSWHKFIIGISFAAAVFLALVSSASATTNINPDIASHWAWNDVIGWIDFYNTQSVNVNLYNLTGYASSSAGDISLDCATTRNANVCDQSNYQVINDGVGNLSGWAWNDQYGWISFDCHNSGGNCSPPYEVYIDNSGDFHNYAWNDVIGWISFNCADYGCGNNYKVNTAWVTTSTTATLDSSIFDTGITAGAELNSVLWHGSQPAGTSVWFQFATSNVSSGPWTYVGSDGTSNTNYGIGPDLSLKLSYTPHNNKRYFRYRVFLKANQAQTVSPRVDDIIVNWSP